MDSVLNFLYFLVCQIEVFQRLQYDGLYEYDSPFPENFEASNIR